MRTMMKRNDGYALSYVLIVLLVLAAIAIASMTLSIKVMESQKATIDRMQDRYTAQGMIEQVVALLGITKVEFAPSDTIPSIENTQSAEVEAVLEDIETIVLSGLDPENSAISITPDDTNPLLLNVEVITSNIKITTQLELEPKMEIVSADDNGATPIDNEDTGIEEPTPEKALVGYTITYRTYSTEAIMAEETEGGAAA